MLSKPPELKLVLFGIAQKAESNNWRMEFEVLEHQTNVKMGPTNRLFMTMNITKIV